MNELSYMCIDADTYYNNLPLLEKLTGDFTIVLILPEVANARRYAIAYGTDEDLVMLKLMLKTV